MTTINTDKARHFSKLLKDFQQRHGLLFSDLAFGLRVKEEDLRKWMGTDKEVPVEPPAREYDRLFSILTSFNRMFSPRKKPEPKVWLDFVEIPIVTGNGVTLIPYLMSTTPITNEVYGVFLEATNHRKPSYWDNTAYNRPKQPVVGVSWDDAMAFCDWAGVSLPSEAQWEYACRAGSTTKYHFGDDPKQLGEYAWYYENSKGRLQDVAQKKPNAWGLYDMHGNVWEWTADHCDVNGRSQYSLRGGSVINSPCQLTNSGSNSPDFCHDNLGFRVIKGSSFGAASWSLCSTNSSKFTPDFCHNNLGFRVVRGGSGFSSAEFCRSSYRSWNEPALRFDYLGFRIDQQSHQRISYIACQSVDPQKPQ